jgi:hypothetical protein
MTPRLHVSGGSVALLFCACLVLLVPRESEAQTENCLKEIRAFMKAFKHVDQRVGYFHNGMPLEESDYLTGFQRWFLFESLAQREYEIVDSGVFFPLENYFSRTCLSHFSSRPYEQLKATFTSETGKKDSGKRRGIHVFLEGGFRDLCLHLVKKNDTYGYLLRSDEEVLNILLSTWRWDFSQSRGLEYVPCTNLAHFLYEQAQKLPGLIPRVRMFGLQAEDDEGDLEPLTGTGWFQHVVVLVDMYNGKTFVVDALSHPSIIPVKDIVSWAEKTYPNAKQPFEAFPLRKHKWAPLRDPLGDGLKGFGAFK